MTAPVNIDYVQRRAEIAALIQRGVTYQDVGKQFGITRERVRQIAKQYNLGGGEEIMRSRRDKFLADYRETHDRIGAQKRANYSGSTVRRILREQRGPVDHEENWIERRRVPLPSWVPSLFTDEYQTFGLLYGEEIAASHLRKLLAEARAA